MLQKSQVSKDNCAKTGASTPVFQNVSLIAHGLFAQIFFKFLLPLSPEGTLQA